MRLRQLLLVGAVISASISSSWAALAPNYQRLAELQAILGEAAVTEALKARPIDRIEFIKTDLYRVTAGPCQADIALADLPQEAGRVGPRQFTLKVVASACPD